MTAMKSLWLAGGALLAAATMLPLPGQAAPVESGFAVAQAQGGGAAPDKKKEEQKKGAPRHKPAPAPKQQPKPPAAAPHRTPPPTAHRPAPPHPAQSTPVRKPAPPRPAQAAPIHKPAPPHPAQAAPVHKPAPPAQAAPARKPPSPTVQKPSAPAPAKSAAPAAQQKPPERRAGPERRDHRRETQPQPTPKQAAPSKSAAPAPSGARTAAPAVTRQPVKPRNANEFIRKDNKQPQRTMKDVRKERRTTRQNGRTLVHEGDRTIVRERNHTFIRHDEDQRFAIGARDVRVEHRDGETITVIVRPDGVRIISVTGRDGRLIRRIRRYPDGREIVIIDNRDFGPDAGYFIDVPPPHIRMPYSRYAVDTDRASEAEIYATLTAPPVEPIDHVYSLDQVRYSPSLRMLMPRLDLSIRFDSGAWQLTPDQVDRLGRVAEALNRAIDRNPREVFLIEGHTDAVGSQDDNLSLSDRRAEAVAVALTEAYGVPPENLVTQGYGEQELKVLTGGPSAANRRVAIRRITPLIDRSARR